MSTMITPRNIKEFVDGLLKERPLTPEELDKYRIYHEDYLHRISDKDVAIYAEVNNLSIDEAHIELGECYSYLDVISIPYTKESEPIKPEELLIPENFKRFLDNRCRIPNIDNDIQY